MKTLLTCLLALLVSSPLGQGALVYAEYVITQGGPDNDPGLGNGVEITLPANGEGANLQFTVPPATIAALSPGFYLLAVRAEDDEGNWCTTLSRTFVVRAPPSETLPSDSAVEELELFMGELSGDNDPGTGSGVSVDLGNPATLLNNSYHFSGSEIAALPPGLYRLAARAKNEAGLWSQTVTRTVKIIEIPTPESFEVRYRLEGAGVSQSGLLSNGPVVNLSESYQSLYSLQNLPPGQYNYYAEVVTGFGQVDNFVAASFDLVTHTDYWDQRYFTEPADRANPDLAGPDADPNRDGLSNRESFILGLDPESNTLAGYGARRGRAGRGVAFITLPPALPPGTTIRAFGSPDLSTPFAEQVLITSPRNILPSLDIATDLATNPFNFAHDDLELTSNIAPDWQAKGFYQFTFAYSGDWPYSFD